MSGDQTGQALLLRSKVIVVGACPAASCSATSYVLDYSEYSWKVERGRGQNREWTSRQGVGGTTSFGALNWYSQEQHCEDLPRTAQSVVVWPCPDGGGCCHTANRARQVSGSAALGLCEAEGGLCVFM